MVEDSPLTLKEANLNEDPIEDDQDWNDKMLIASLQVNWLSRKTKLGLNVHPRTWWAPTDGRHKDLQDVKVKDDLVYRQGPWFQVELQQACLNCIVVNIAAGLFRETVHATKSNRNDIMHTSVTPKDVPIDQHKRLIRPTSNCVAQSNMATLSQQLITLSRCQCTRNMANFAPSKISTPGKKNPFVRVNWVIGATDSQHNMNAKQLLTSLTIGLEEMQSRICLLENRKAAQAIQVSIIDPF